MIAWDFSWGSSPQRPSLGDRHAVWHDRMVNSLYLLTYPARWQDDEETLVRRYSADWGQQGPQTVWQILSSRRSVARLARRFDLLHVLGISMPRTVHGNLRLNTEVLHVLVVVRLPIAWCDDLDLRLAIAVVPHCV